MDYRQEVELTLLPGVDDTTAFIEWQIRGTRFNEVKAAASSRLLGPGWRRTTRTWSGPAASGDTR